MSNLLNPKGGVIDVEYVRPDIAEFPVHEEDGVLLIGGWKQTAEGRWVPDEHEDYAALYNTEEQTIQVVWSKYVVYCGRATQCYPDQGNIDQQMGATVIVGVMAYALPPEDYTEAWLNWDHGQFTNRDRIMLRQAVEMMYQHLHGKSYLLGKFYGYLWEAIFAADRSNLEKLEQGFPEEVRARRNYADVWARNRS